MTDLRIGEVAERVGVSSRTVRYYEERGMLTPSARSAGGSRRYSESDVARLCRIRELQDLLGFDLDAIAAVLTAEDRLSDLRELWYRGDLASRDERINILAEARDLNQRMRHHVRDKMTRLEAFLTDLDGRAARVDAAERDLPEAE